MVRAAIATTITIGVIGACAAPAVHAESLHYCDDPPRLSAAEQGRLLSLAAVVRSVLAEAGDGAALVSRSGLALERLGQRYSHAGIALPENAGSWSVRQLYYACDERVPRLYDQGLAGFVMGLADPARVDQVMQNLVGNALKFSSGGTRTTVRVTTSPSAVRFEVEDEGPGLTADDLTKLFRKHARLSNRPTGGEHSSGHGLAICKRMIELHGGRIGANNNPVRGSTFWFELPTNPDGSGSA